MINSDQEYAWKKLRETKITSYMKLQFRNHMKFKFHETQYADL